MKLLSLLFVTVFMAHMSLAHEGHDQTPGSVKSMNGGVVKAGKEINLEYVVSGNELKLFPTSHEGQALKDVKLSGTIKSPKGKKAEELIIEQKNGSYTAKVDFKGAYRLETTITALIGTKKDSFKFQIER